MKVMNYPHVYIAQDFLHSEIDIYNKSVIKIVINSVFHEYIEIVNHISP